MRQHDLEHLPAILFVGLVAGGAERRGRCARDLFQVVRVAWVRSMKSSFKIPRTPWRAP